MKLDDFRWFDDPKNVPDEWMWGRIRLWRNSELAKTDFTQLPDVDVDKIAWKKYRKALRDITNFDTPKDIVWPVSPGDV